MAAFCQQKRCAYLYYDAADNPLSILYCPTWGDTVVDQDPPLNLYRSPSDTTAADVFNAGIYIPDKYHPDKGHLTLKKVDNFIKVRCGANQLLGCDFWTGTQINANTPSIGAVGSPGSPVFLCLGVNGRFFGEDASKVTQRVSTETETNFSSIISVLYWSGSDGVSMYWAGDAVESVEADFVRIATGFLGGRRVGIHKLSHHGAKSSTPEALLNTLNPHKIIVSAAQGKGYGHPHQETINRLESPTRKLDAQSLFTTRYPHRLNSLGATHSDCVAWDKLSPIRRPLSDPTGRRSMIACDYFLLEPAQADSNRYSFQTTEMKSNVSDAVYIQHLLIQCNQDNNTNPEVQMFAVEEQLDYGKIANLIHTHNMPGAPKAKADPCFWGADHEEAVISLQEWAVVVGMAGEQLARARKEERERLKVQAGLDI
ncbi:hypothetical protein BJX64DRAFT_291421 [Aspergillus heterothallicus]